MDCPNNLFKLKKIAGAVAKTDNRVCNLIGSRIRIVKIEWFEQRVICQMVKLTSLND